MGPYAYQGDQWVSFDDIAMIRYKSEWARDMGLGGGMVWALDLDDFTDRCHCEPYPLLRTINRVLRGYRRPDPKCTLTMYKDGDKDGDGDGNVVEAGVVDTAVFSGGEYRHGAPRARSEPAHAVALTPACDRRIRVRQRGVRRRGRGQGVRRLDPLRGA